MLRLDVVELHGEDVAAALDPAAVEQQRRGRTELVPVRQVLVQGLEVR